MDPLKHVKERKPRTLNPDERIAFVLKSQGHHPKLAEELPADVLAQLGALCGDDGHLVPGTRDKAKAIFDTYNDSQKATVDEAAKQTPVNKEPTDDQ